MVLIVLTNRAMTGAATLILLTAIGCSRPPDRDQRLADLAQQAVEQQAKQNERMARQSQAVVEESHELAEAAKELIALDAETRREMVAAQHELSSQLNQHRATVDAARDRLEDERREIAKQRNRDPIISASIQTVGLFVACLLPLVVCVFLLRQLSRSEPDDQAVCELLIHELVTDQPRLLPGPSLRPVLEHHADRDIPDDAPTDPQPDAADLPF